MKRVLLYVIFAGFLFNCKAQAPDPALARVYYQLSHIMDTTERAIAHEEKMLLVIGKNASVFTSYDKIINMAKITALIKEQTKANGGTLQGLTMRPGLMTKMTYSDFYIFLNERRTFAIENISQKYIIEEELSPINWKISNDTASFSGISCRKAVAKYRGRNWIAWYAPSLPFQSGPWKLYGLPGLIISAYDEKKEVQFKFEGLEEPSDKDVVSNEILSLGTTKLDFSNEIYMGKEIKLPKNAIKATRAEVNRLKQAFADNAKAGLGADSQSITSKRISQSPLGSKAKTIKLNNPIELP